MHNTPFQIEFAASAFEKAKENGEVERRIGGIVSTDHLDRQQETLIQEGLDFRPFLKGGFFNDNHSRDMVDILGYPDTAELRELADGNKGWYVEGYLLNTPRAAEVWGLANELQRSGSGRSLGFSVEGTIVDRDPNDRSTVRKAVVREVAITKCPVNEATSMIVLSKALVTGTAATNGQPGSGFALRPEALEGSPSKPEEESFVGLTKAEVTARIRAVFPNASPSFIQKAIDYATRWHSAT